ncbi:VCBS domain-containing protein [Microvirga sp. G4-2]|uniref:VCBS domain-containing protein n=1 Tax=Microvirga sp. G4-2 TaxID=3434467 RepID=UPI004043C0BF
MILSFTSYLLQNSKISVSAVLSDGTLKDGTLTQSQFSTFYTDWLKAIFSNTTVHDWVQQTSASGFTYDVSNFTININQNGSLLPTITNAAGQTLDQTVLNALFTDKDSMLVGTGKTSQERSYVYGFEQTTLKAMFAPKVSGPVTGEATEDGNAVSLSALAKVTDADTPTSSLTVNAPTSLPPGVSYDAQAKSFILDPTHTSFQSLAAGSETKVTVDYTITDDSGFTTSASVIWTVKGINDAASISGAHTGSVTEDGVQTTSGTLTVNDIDTGENVFEAVLAGDLTKDYGSFTFDESNGAWQFTIDNAAAQSLGANDVVHQKLTVISKDGTANETITVDVHGVNDAASITGTNAGSVTEDNIQTANGTLAVHDVDSGENLFQAVASADLAKAYGSFTFDADTGAWDFTIDNDAAQSLGTGEIALQSLTVLSKDGTASETITVEVHGINDAASISGTKSGTVYEDAASPGELSTASGTLTVSDVDSGENVFQAVSAGSLVKEYGAFTFDAKTGAWEFTIDNAAAQSLGAGQVVQQTLTVTSEDGTASETITVNVVGKAEPVMTPTKVVLSDFETGTLASNGWTVTTGGVGNDGGATAAITTVAGNKAAEIVATASISKTVSLTAGDVFQFDWMFDSVRPSVADQGNDIAYYIDQAGAKHTLATAFSGDTAWATSKFTAAADGTYTFVIGVENDGTATYANTYDSKLYVDNVLLFDI